MTILGSILKKAKYGLEARMTLHIVATVIIVSIAMTAIAAFLYKNKYEQDLNDELESAREITEKIIDIEIGKIETGANTAAQLYDYESNDKKNIDNSLIHSLKGNPVQVATTVILGNDSFSKEKLYTVVSYNGKIEPLNISYKQLKHLKDDDNWKQSYFNGKKYWSMPYVCKFKDSTKLKLISYSVPITNKQGKRIGIYCSSITLDWLTKKVKESKISNDIDVTIVADDGNYLVKPGQDINSIPEEDLIVKKKRIDHLGWNFIFSSPHSTIMRCVWKSVLKIILFASLLILILCLSIIYNVRHVARPFVNEQKHIAREKASMDKEVSLAANIQRKLLTDASLQKERFSINASLSPAKNIGGDLYDYTVRDNKIYFCIGDVSGKGVSASLFMAMTTVLFRHTINEEHIEKPCDIVSKINHTLSLENSECMFVTFFMGILHLDDGTLDYCNAGHNAPVLNAKFIEGESGMPMGIDSDSEYETVTTHLEHGDRLLLYTDGVTEAKNTANEYYGEERLLTMCNENRTALSGDTIEEISKDIAAFSNGAEQHDDITMLCIKYN